MSKGKFILVNGSFIPSDDYRISVEELQSAHFSEYFRSVKTSFPFFSETLDLIKLKLLLFNAVFPEFTDEEGAGLKRQMERTLTKNKHFLGAKVTLTFWIADKKVTYTIQSETIEPAGYQLNEKGLFAEVFDKIQKPASSLSTLSLGSVAYWEIAERYRTESPTDEFIIIGNSDTILETPGANIYLVRGKKVKGASAEDGAYVDVTQSLLLHIFVKLGLEYTEEEITLDELKQAEEVFSANAIQGIQWIIGIGGKRYFNNTTRKIAELFNNLTIS